jgi:hypothetical protein
MQTKAYLTGSTWENVNVVPLIGSIYRALVLGKLKRRAGGEGDAAVCPCDGSLKCALALPRWSSHISKYGGTKTPNLGGRV